jgi:uncharacterized membrane protein YbhN (UPF0104 family)
MRKLLIALVLLLGVVFLIGQAAEVQTIAETLRRGDWRFLLLAVAVEVAWMFNVAASYRAILQATGIEERIEKLILLAAAANFANIVAPTAGMSGMAVFISEARKRGYSPGKVTISGGRDVFAGSVSPP